MNLKDHTTLRFLLAVLTLAAGGCGSPRQVVKDDEVVLVDVEQRPEQDNETALADVEQLVKRLDLLPDNYKFNIEDGLYASIHIKEIKDGTFDFDAANAASLSFGLEAIQLTQRPGFSLAEVIAKEVEVFQKHGYFLYEGTIESMQPLHVIESSSPEFFKVVLGVKVALGETLTTIPDERGGWFVAWLKSMMSGSGFEYSARIDVANEDGRLIIKSHELEGEELSPDTIRRIIRRNVSTLASMKMMGLIKPAAAKALNGERPNRRNDGDNRGGAPGGESLAGRAKSVARADQSIPSIENGEFRAKVEAMLASLPKRFPERQILVASSAMGTHRIASQSRASDLLSAVERSWILYSCRTRCKKNYSVKSLAAESAEHISTAGVAALLVDLSVEPSVLPFVLKRGRDVEAIQLRTEFAVLHLSTCVPFVPPSWLAEAAWGGLPQTGEITINIPVMADPNGDIMCDAAAVAHEGGGQRPAFWVAAGDVLNEETLAWLIGLKVGFALGEGCRARVGEALSADADSRIWELGRLYGSEVCLPEAAVQEDGIDLAVLEGIRNRIDRDEYWGAGAPESTALSLAEAKEDLTKLAGLRKPRSWKNTKGGQVVAHPRFLDASVVVFDESADSELAGRAGRRDFVLGMWSSLREERRLIDVAGRRSLDRMQQLALSAVGAINRGGAQAVGGDFFPEDFDVKALYGLGKATLQRDEAVFADSDAFLGEMAMISLSDADKISGLRSLSVSLLRPIIRERLLWLLDDEQVEAAVELLERIRPFDPELEACVDKVSQAAVLLAAGQEESAERLGRDAYADAVSAGDVCKRAECARVLAAVHLARGRADDALAVLEETLESESGEKVLVGFPEDFGRLLDAFARAALESGKPELAFAALKRAKLCYVLSLPPKSPELKRVDELLGQLLQSGDAGAAD
jgi:hypothetical protein